MKYRIMGLFRKKKNQIIVEVKPTPFYTDKEKAYNDEMNDALNKELNTYLVNNSDKHFILYNGRISAMLKYEISKKDKLVSAGRYYKFIPDVRDVIINDKRYRITMWNLDDNNYDAELLLEDRTNIDIDGKLNIIAICTDNELYIPNE